MDHCTKTNIWQWAQNKPTQIVADITSRYPDVDPNFIYNVLLRRGVFKWLSVRRDIIRLKDKWKQEVVRLNRPKTVREKGYYEALLHCRAQVRRLCHSARFRAPDHDRQAQKYIDNLEG